MARPVKWRRIGRMPTVFRFSPPDSGAGENVMKLEELEALRLKDLEGLEQAECALQMGVSRPTFHRILLSARGKVSDSLNNGKSIRIDGGHFTRNICPIRCMDCGREWSESVERVDGDAETPSYCPKCHSEHLECCPDDAGEQGESCRRRCRHRGGHAPFTPEQP